MALELKGFYPLIENQVYARPIDDLPAVQEIVILDKYRFPSFEQFDKHICDVVAEMKGYLKLNAEKGSLEIDEAEKVKYMLALFPPGFTQNANHDLKVKPLFESNEYGIFAPDIIQNADECRKLLKDFFENNYGLYSSHLYLDVVSGLVEDRNLKQIKESKGCRDWGEYHKPIEESMPNGLGFRIGINVPISEDPAKNVLPEFSDIRIFLERKAGQEVKGSGVIIEQSDHASNKEVLEFYSKIPIPLYCWHDPTAQL